MTAVAAFPDGHAGLFEDFHGLDIGQKFAVALFVHLLNGAHAAELFSEVVEAFLVGFTGHALIHVGPLGILALCGMQKVFFRRADTAQCLEPELGMLLLVVSGVQEEGSDLFISGLFGDGSEIGILVSCHGFAGKGFHQVLFGFGAGIAVCALDFAHLSNLRDFQLSCSAASGSLPG